MARWRGPHESENEHDDDEERREWHRLDQLERRRFRDKRRILAQRADKA